MLYIYIHMYLMNISIFKHFKYESTLTRTTPLGVREWSSLQSDEVLVQNQINDET